MQGGATQAMSGHIVEERQRRRCPLAARNPKGAWVLRAISSLLVGALLALLCSKAEPGGIMLRRTPRSR